MSLPRSSSAADRFWSRVRKGSGCWVWTASFFPDGYGQHKNTDGLPTRAHRAAYTLEHGPLAPGVLVMHDCDNPRCVRPEHLTTGTQRRNMRDRIARGRTRTGTAPTHRILTDAERRVMRSLRTAGTKLEALARQFRVTLRTVKLTCRGLGPRSRVA